MSAADVSLVVTAHDETLVCGPTMTSADIAVDAARSAGYRVEAVVALANATEATTAYFAQPPFDHWDRQTFDADDLTHAQNIVLPQISGRLVTFLRSGDLISENWLADGVACLIAATARGERIIAHPEVVVVFDGQRSVYQNVDQDAPTFTPHYLYADDRLDAACLAPREAHLQALSVSDDLRNDLSCPDRQFAIETMARGWKHVVVPDTIVFKRHRDSSPGMDSHSRKSIIRFRPEMRIDRIRDLNRPSHAG